MYILSSLTLIALLLLLGSIGYLRKGWFKQLYHDMFKWHVPKENSLITDGVNNYGICKYCDKIIQQDSQGNWF